MSSPDTKKKEFEQLLTEAAPSDKLALFFNLQEQRATISNKFSEAFKTFSKDQDLEEYNKKCTSITLQLSSLGAEIIQIENSLSTSNPEWSKTISKIRELEKSKFLLTVEDQVLKTEIDNSKSLISNQVSEQPTAGSCFYEHIEICEKQIKENKLKFNQYIESINEHLENLKYDLNETSVGINSGESKEHEHTHECKH
ncbi:hypothetical protein DICPUDRAFT_85952 [Dictyostelium purpureum]|uniref:Uncharacterized protein n=1 Tax=Dictyostelium purpureum TaxID=5786 RepID=F0Z8G7_DICPU|nr:uncharacterized protein DICPUDRAFT_85952 [Dictyostelium purpureum]EGC39755.1 hypothetical protein DICPUDRAFT_85952 [Dictyostelium purpureum]|eukprot:XP_003283741.1 hypothetical protein DICPUDRAFT_85952 [Dictyostelium purpureum]